MQLVLSNNRVVAHGENFLSMGGVVINTETGEKHENATIAECDGCPSDIDKVGYEYHAGVFVPCAPFGVGNNNGYFMEVCEHCATPRSSGIPINKGLGVDNVNFIQLIWENASPSSKFPAQDISANRRNYLCFIIEFDRGYGLVLHGGDYNVEHTMSYYVSSDPTGILDGGVTYERVVELKSSTIEFGDATASGKRNGASHSYLVNGACLVPIRIYGVKL